VYQFFFYNIINLQKAKLPSYLTTPATTPQDHVQQSAKHCTN